MSTEQEVDGRPEQGLRERRAELQQGGGPDRLAKQKKEGKLTARERIDALVDAGSFEEIGLFAQHRQTHFGMAGKEVPADGVVTGAASVDGRLVHLASQDFTVLGGSAGEVHSHKVADVMELSLHTGSPFVFINDSGGARVQEGIDSLSGYGQVFFTNVELSGAVPQISLICGPCAGGAAYSPALTDFIIMTRQAQMFITGPQVIKQVTGEQITAEALGGADAHMAHSGVIHFVAQDDQDAIDICRRLLSFLPSNNLEEPPASPTTTTSIPTPSWTSVVPVEPKQGYDMRDVIGGIVDQGDFLEVQAGHARTWSSASAGSWAGRSASSPTSPGCSPARSISTPRSRPAGSFASATRSTSRWSRSSTCPAFCPGAAGVRRDHPQRGQDAVRLLGGHRAQDPGDPSQILRRGPPGDVLEGPRGRSRLRLADRRGRRHGGRRGRRNRVSQGNGGAPRTRPPAEPS